MVKEDKRAAFAVMKGCRNTSQPKKQEKISMSFYTLVFAIFLMLAITVSTSSSLILA